MQFKLNPLSEQTIVITGATSGIGLCTARMAASRGANVVAVARNEVALCELVDEINASGGSAIYAVADVADEEALQRAAESARQQFGGPRRDQMFIAPRNPPSSGSVGAQCLAASHGAPLERVDLVCWGL